MIDLVASLASFVIARCDALQVDVQRTGVAPLAVRQAVTAIWEGDPCGPRPKLRLVVHDADGRRRVMLVQPEQTVWVRGFEASVDVAAGASVTGREARIQLDPRLGSPVAGAGPWRARVPLQPGVPLTDRVVARQPTAQRGDAVDVVVRRGGIRLSVPGELLVDGRAGELVRVRHEAGDRVVTGRLVNSSTVEIP